MALALFAELHHVQANINLLLRGGGGGRERRKKEKKRLCLLVSIQPEAQ